MNPIKEAVQQGRADKLPADVLSEAQKMVDRAMFQLYSIHPFWGLLISRCDLVATLRMPTAAISEDATLYFNPLFMLDLTVPQQKFVLAHEVAHCAFLHHKRMADRHPYIWNLATDYQINYMLSKSMRPTTRRTNGSTKSQNPVPPGLYATNYSVIEDLSAEQVYEMLLVLYESDEEEEEASSNASFLLQAAKKGDLDRDSPVPKHTPFGAKLKDQYSRLFRDFKNDKENEDGGMNTSQYCAVGEASITDSSDIMSGGEGGEGDVVMRENGAAKPKDYRDWAQAMKEAQTNAKMQGNMPAYLEKLVDDFADPVIDWPDAFRQTLDRSVVRDRDDDWSYMYPHRRFLDANFIVPSLVGHESCGVVAVDTSGSMSADFSDGTSVLDQAFSEIEGLRKEEQLRIHLIECDAEVHEGVWVDWHEELPPVRGGGGTSFVPVFEYVNDVLIEEEGVEIDFLAFLTDGHGTFPQHKPPYDVIWCMMDSSVEPPFGQTIYVQPTPQYAQ